MHKIILGLKRSWHWCPWDEISASYRYIPSMHLPKVGARLPLRWEYKRPCTQKSTPLGVLAGVNSLWWKQTNKQMVATFPGMCGKFPLFRQNSQVPAIVLNFPRSESLKSELLKQITTKNCIKIGHLDLKFWLKMCTITKFDEKKQCFAPYFCFS